MATVLSGNASAMIHHTGREGVIVLEQLADASCLLAFGLGPRDPGDIGLLAPLVNDSYTVVSIAMCHNTRPGILDYRNFSGYEIGYRGWLIVQIDYRAVANHSA